MAFNNESLVRIGGQNQAQSIFTYTTSDSLATVEASAYFNLAVGKVRADDYILARIGSSDYLLRVDSDSLPITTATLQELPAVTQSTGWSTYVDTQYPNSGSAFTLTANSDAQLPNNAGTKNETQKPSDVTTFYDGSVITGRNGDNLDVMIYFKAIPSAASQWLDIWIDIGGAVGELYRQTFSFPKGSGVERGILYALPSAYTLGTWEANGGTVYVRSNANLDIHSINFNFDRSHKAR